MSLLSSSVPYDPATAVTKSTTALLAMTAVDTANLRRVFTAPPSGVVECRIYGTLVGSAGVFPDILLGVLEGSTVKARVVPCGNVIPGSNRCAFTAMFNVTGLAAGSHTFDLAYSVEVAVASTGIMYGGPNDTTTNNAWGQIGFEVWAT